MKWRIVAFLVLIICCHYVSGQREPKPVVKIEFSTFKRGYQKQVFFTADSVIQMVSNRGREEFHKRRTDPVEWESLINEAGKVSISKLDSLLAPSARRTFDGAMHSSITITDKSGSSGSHTFDDEFPHQDLQPLMEVIKKIMGPNAGR